MEFGVVGDLLFQEPPDDRAARSEDEHEREHQRKERAELELVEHLEQRVAAVFSEPLVVGLEKVVEHLVPELRASGVSSVSRSGLLILWDDESP